MNHQVAAIGDGQPLDLVEAAESRTTTLPWGRRPAAT
jgi:hypothetical protein